MKYRTTIIAVSLHPFLSGCSNSGGKNASDAVQFMLRQDAGTRWLFCFLFVLALWQGLKVFKAGIRVIWWSIKSIKPVFVRLRLRNLLVVAVISTMVWGMSDRLADMIQELEQRYLTSVWIGKTNNYNEEHLTAIYEAALAKNVDPYELEVVKKRTREMAAKIQTTPLCIYECAYLECALNPFTIRKDLVAAGWIQFTKVGLLGLTYQGKSVNYDQVLYACRNRNINLMMDLSEIYLVDKYKRAGEKPLHNTVDLYLALFAPAFIGAPHDKVVYQGYQNPSYYLNKGLDGWYTVDSEDGRRQIFRKNGACDGAITIWEMYLALEAKKGRIIQNFVH